ncbi:sensor histidine kinase [Paraburkholderia sp. J41]|uniref:sensor histidine kinase n=1 Tax=Paraburkholderia sp. J41 TaxID=2805433 RepID=UPI002AC35FF4|nr:ATP-binding protein [Paraburkholderia sp. J41]
MIEVLSFLEHLCDPYLVLDGELAFAGANAAWRELFEDAESSGSFGVSDDLLRAVAAQVADSQLRQLRQSPMFRLDIRSRQQGGGERRRYWHMHFSAMPAAQDRPPLIVLRFEDVTAQVAVRDSERLANAKLRSYARLRQIIAEETGEERSSPMRLSEIVLAAAGLGAWRLDLATGNVECNDPCLRDLALEHATQLSRSRLLGETADAHPAHPAHPAQSLTQAGEPFEIEHRVEQGDGPRWVLVRGTATAEKDGGVRYVSGITLDITARKTRELEASALADAERYAREQSEALARTMDEFVAAVSHELRSPLNAIISWAELLRLSADPSAVTKAGDAIRRNGRQLSLMVDDLLDSGAIAAGKLSVQLQPLDLGALATLAAEDVRKQAERKNLTLSAANVASCIVMGDDGRMRQVVWNLLSNAIKFTEEGSIEIAVSVDGASARLTVEDTGRGIASEQLPLIFERFVQIDPSSSGRAGGLGLGLWLVKHIVQLHGGTVSATSRGVGHGSVFTVTLPLMS